MDFLFPWSRRFSDEDNTSLSLRERARQEFTPQLRDLTDSAPGDFHSLRSGVILWTIRDPDSYQVVLSPERSSHTHTHVHTYTVHTHVRTHTGVYMRTQTYVMDLSVTPSHTTQSPWRHHWESSDVGSRSHTTGTETRECPTHYTKTLGVPGLSGVVPNDYEGLVGIGPGTPLLLFSTTTGVWE